MAGEMRPMISVIMPAYNEAGSLRQVVLDVDTVLRDWSHEIVIVDDGSTDSTWQEIQKLRADRSDIRGVRLTRNFGHQAALVAGLKAATGAAVIMMDADGQHPAELLPAFVRQWQAGSPIVQAVRTTSDAGWGKRLTSRVFYRFWSALSGVPIVSGAADFRLLDRRVVDTLLDSGGSLIFLRGLIPWLGYPISYVPFSARTRIAGHTGYTWRRMLRLSVDGLTAFSVVPLRISMALGISMSIVSLVYLCYIVLVWIFSNRVVSGWASTAGLVSLVGGIQLFTIGVLGEYVGRIFLRTTDRPQFIVAETMVPAIVEPGLRPERSARRRVHANGVPLNHAAIR